MENRKWKIENGKKPVRMCVVCRQRNLQESLIRLQCINGNLVHFSGRGRSFYVCEGCVGNKRFINFISKICNIAKNEAKELIFHFSFSI